MSINRYKITAKGIEQAKMFLDGKITKSKAPKFAQAFENDLKFVGKKLYYKNLRVIPMELLESTFRNAVYKKNSTIPLNRDQGYQAISKIIAGAPRRKWAEFFLKQNYLRKTDPLPRADKKSGRAAKNLLEFEADLMEVMPKQLPDSLKKKIKHSYIVTVVHRVSSFTKLLWAPNKRPLTITPLIIKAITEICALLRQPIAGTVVISDAGHEISGPRLKRVKIKHIIQKLGHSVEARNGVARRTLFKVLAAKRGGFESSLKQTEKILNNMASKIHKNKTPLEVVQQSSEESIGNFNSKRQRSTANNRPALKVGDRVRRALRQKKNVMYKSNSGVQWDPKTYKILGVTKKQPHRYRLLITEKIKNVVTTKKRWFTRDSLQLLPAKDDMESHKLLRARDQTGAPKKAKPKAVIKKNRPRAQKVQPSKAIGNELKRLLQ